MGISLELILSHLPQDAPFSVFQPKLETLGNTFIGKEIVYCWGEDEEWILKRELGKKGQIDRERDQRRKQTRQGIKRERG